MRVIVAFVLIRIVQILNIRVVGVILIPIPKERSLLTTSTTTTSTSTTSTVTVATRRTLLWMVLGPHDGRGGQFHGPSHAILMIGFP